MAKRRLSILEVPVLVKVVFSKPNTVFNNPIPYIFDIKWFAFSQMYNRLIFSVCHRKLLLKMFVWGYLLLLLPTSAWSQSCECTNCPVDIPISTTVTAEFPINGAANNDLADPGQGVCGVYISFEHEFIWNIEMVLTSPDGQQVTLVGPNVIPPFGSYTGFTDWMVTFLPCSEPVAPDPGFSPIWSNNQPWLALQDYTGSYYPYSGCLEDFNFGSVDGNWTLTVVNNHPFYTGEVIDFEVIFCDSTGMGCALCEADAGDLSAYPEITECEGDVNLLLNIPPAYTGTEPDTTMYEYYYVVTQDGDILGFDTVADLRSYPGGVYEVCGLSFAHSDSLLIPPLTDTLAITDLENDLGSNPPLFCGSLSDTCVMVNILSVNTLFVDTICAGGSYDYMGQQLDTTDVYSFVFPSVQGCGDSTVTIDLTVLDSIQQYVSGTICEGEVFSFNGQDFGFAGQYFMTLPGNNALACDTFVTIDVAVLDTTISNLSATICEGESYVVGDSTYTVTGNYTNVFPSFNSCDSLVHLSLSVNALSTTNIAATICEGESYEVGDSTYTVADNYTNVFTGFNSCDSLVHLSLTVNALSTTNLTATICEGESYVVGDSTYTVTGNYTNVFPGFNNCDSLVHLSLTVNALSVTDLNATICEGDSYSVGDSTYTVSGNYTNVFTGFNNCDSLVHLSLTVNALSVTDLNATICEGDSYSVGDSTYTVGGNYTNTFTGFNNCDSLVHLSLTVNALSTTNLTATICEGESYVVGDSTYTVTGNYTNVFPGFNSCDSLVHLSLTVNALSTTNLTATICEGESYSVGDSTYSATGIYNNVLTSAAGCDSLVNLDLTVSDFYQTNLTASICEGEDYVVGDSTYTESGDYVNDFVAQNGCDSLVYLTLSVNQSQTEDIVATICEGESYSVGDSTYATTGIYNNLLTSTTGCDSLVHLDLTVSDFYQTNLTASICAGEDYVVGDSIYTESGDYVNDFIAQNGCDSLVFLSLVVNQSQTEDIVATICEGESYSVGDSTYATTGIYNNVLTSAAGCDSLVNLDLTVSDFYQTNLTASICEGESYPVGDSTYTDSGDYVNDFVAQNGCDSLVYLSLAVNQPQTEDIVATICEGETYSIGDSTYATTGIYNNVLTSAAGCDSLVNLDLTVSDFYQTNLTASICEGESYPVGDSTYTESGDYVNDFIAQNGCDSLVNLDLTVSDFYQTNLTASICEGEDYVVGDSTYTESGDYVNDFVAQNGCDSLVYLTLSVNQSQTEDIVATICEGETYSIGDSTYATTGIYNNVLTSTAGCDSLVNLDLTVSDFYQTNLTASICEGESYPVGDSTYNESGDYTNDFIAQNGCDSLVFLSLAVNQSQTEDIVATICEGESYSVGDSTYATTGIYNNLLTSTAGCDSLVHLDLTVSDFYQTNLTASICEGEDYVVGDSSYTESGDYINDFVAQNGCDSLVFLSLAVNQSQTEDIVETICEGESYSVGDSTYATTGIYNNVLTSAAGCDSLVNLDLTVSDFYQTNLTASICEGESYSVGDSTYTDSGDYVNDFVAQNGCDSLVYLTLSVNQPQTENIVATICEGESYSVGDSTYTVTGNYNNVLTSAAGCDSLVNLDLTVSDFYQINLTASICEGEIYPVGDSTYTESGDYVNDFVAQNGCDSLVYLTLSVNQSQTEDIVATICEGESYSVGDSTYATTGIYNNLLTSTAGCDSLVNLDLTVSDFYQINLTASICEGESYPVGDSTYTESGDYVNDFVAENGCDSLVYLALVVNQSQTEDIVATICEGESYSVGDSTYTTTGIYNNVLTSTAGCDSLVNLDLTVSDFYQTNLTASICEGESYPIGDSTYTESGDYVNDFVAQNGCDSLVFLNLAVNQSQTEDIVATICEGETYSVGDSTYATTGIYNNLLTSTAGCDSLVNLDLTVSDFYQINLTASICEGESYPVGDSIYTESGDYVNDFVAENGCDSLVYLNLVVNQPQTEDITATICEGESYSVGDSTYATTGIYNNVLTSTAGCDSLVNLDLTVSDFYQTNLMASICEGEIYPVGDSTYTESGDYVNDFIAQNGCDSLVYLNLVVNQSQTEDITATICEGESYSVGDSTYATTGIYNNLLTSTAGCDSLVNLDLTVSDFYQINLTASICEGESYPVGDSTYTESGDYVNDFVAQNGCDSLVFLNLAVNQSQTEDIVATICEGETYSVGDSTYATTGIYNNVLTSTAGCDSLVNLDLTVSDFYQINLTASICEGESYPVGDSIYTESGDYVNDFVAENGCDSLVYLNLVVNQSQTEDIVATICEGESYSVGDSTYATTGIYNNLLPSTAGCDSLVNLDLTVSDFYQINLTASICEGESYPVGDSIYTESGDYVNDFVAENGCDSLVYLNLVVNQSQTEDITATICEGETYSVGDSTYTATGIYNNVLTSAAGCDSLVNLDLTVSDFYQTNLTASICEGESYPVGDSTYTESGDYTNDFIAQNGCDSLVYLNLTVNQSQTEDIVATICEGETYSVGDSTYSATGIYNNVLTTTAGCDSLVQLELIVLGPVIEIDLPDTLNCSAASVVLNSVITPSIANSEITFEWSHLNNGNDGIAGGENTATPIVVKSGFYELVVTEEFQGVVCAQNQMVEVQQDTVQPLAAIEALDGTSLDCVNSSLILTGQDSQSIGELALSWWHDDQWLSSQLQLEVGQSGVYTLIVNSLLNGCSDTAVVVIQQDTLLPLAQVVTSETIACSDDFIVLDGNGSSVGNQFQYEWTTSDGNILSGGETLFPEVDQGGSYWLVVTDTDNGCTASAVVEVEPVSEPIETVAFTGEDPSCYGINDGWIGLLDISGGGAPYRYELNGEEAEQPIWLQLGAGSYHILVEDAQGCHWDSLVVLSGPGPVLIDLGEDQQVQLGDSVEFEALVNLPETAIDTLIWAPFGRLLCDSCYQQTYWPVETTTFTATVIDQNGCRATDDILIEVIKDRLVFIPNAFSPNGDGANDRFKIYSGKGVVRINTFQIYDRWGALLYRADNFPPNSPAHYWDGQHLGKPLNPAVFVYFAEILFADGRVEMYKGDITIVK